MSLAKKIFIISSSLLAIILIFWGVYNLAFKPLVPSESLSEINNGASQSEEMSSIKSSASKIEVISEDRVASPIFDKNKNAIKYFSKNDSKLYQIDINGLNKKTLSPEEFQKTSSVLWSPDNSKIILQSNLDGKIRFSYYDLSGGEKILLSENMDTVAWIGSNRISYKYYDPSSKKKTLSVSDPDGKNWSTIADVPYWQTSIAPIPKTALVSFWNSPDGLIETDFRSTSALGADTKILLKGFFGADYLWNIDGDKFLTSHLNEKGGKIMQLAVANANGGEYNNLGIPSFVSKCIWSRDGITIYCALPGSIPETATLPNDYLAGKFKTTDTFWKINTHTGEKSRIVELDKINGSFDAFSLLLNADESLLFFANWQDERLYKITL